MTPFKKRQARLLLILAPSLMLFIVFVFYGRFVAYFSDLEYVEGFVSHCERKSAKPSAAVYLSIGSRSYRYSEPASARPLVEALCRDTARVGLFYHDVATPIVGRRTSHIREMANLDTGAMYFSRAHYYDRERTEVIAAVLLVAFTLLSSIYAALMVAGKLDDEPVEAYKQRYAREKDIQVKSGDNKLEALFMVAVTFGVAGVAAYKIIVDGFSWAYFFMLPLGAFGYASLVGLVNKRRIRILNGVLEVRKGPLPQFGGNMDIDIARIVKIVCDYKVNSSRYGGYETVAVSAVLNNDETVILLFTSTYEEGKAIADTLNRRLKGVNSRHKKPAPA